jgi:hypothetical protein
VGIQPLPGETAVVSDEVARGIRERLRNRGEIQETGYGPSAQMPGSRLFEAIAWPA